MGDHLVEDPTLASKLRRLLAPSAGADLPDPSPLPPGRPEPPPLRGIGAHRRRVAAVDRHPAAAAAVAGPGPDGAGDGRRPKGRIDPRIRQRRIQVKREEGRRRLRALAATTTVLVVVAVGFGALRSPLLRVHHIVVIGADRTPVAAVDAAGRLSPQRLMIDVNGAGAAADIDRLPWVASARVHRSWPTTVVVTVRERSPVAQVGAAGSAELVDGSGRVLGPAPVGAVLPAIELGVAPGATPGSAPAAGAPGSGVTAAYRPGLRVAAALPAALVPRVVAVVVGADGALGLRLSGGSTAILGDATDLGAKLEAVLTMVTRVQVRTATIDASVPTAPVLTAGGGVATFSTHTGG